MTDSTNTPTIDRDFVVRVAALVVARLRAMQHGEATSSGVNGSERSHESRAAGLVASSTTPMIDCAAKVISAGVVEKHPAGTTLSVSAKAIVTPLARDTAKDRGITIKRNGLSK